jgi:hypothetical protein
MKTEDLENELRNLKFIHLTETELAAYCDQKADPMARARMEAHLKQCFICARELELLQEERAVLSNRQVTADEAAFVERLMEQMGLVPKPPADQLTTTAEAVSLPERLADYLRQMMASWHQAFARGAVRGEADQGEALWQWHSADGLMQARGMMEANADLIIRFSSSEMALEGTRFHIHLGLFDQEITLQWVSESEVAAKIAIPWQQRRGDMTKLSVKHLNQG